jgi:uncharacterized protein YllA (UPF0747 family)
MLSKGKLSKMYLTAGSLEGHTHYRSKVWSHLERVNAACGLQNVQVASCSKPMVQRTINKKLAAKCVLRK